MRLAFLLAVACAAPLAAQKPEPPRPTSADTAAILRAVPVESDWVHVVHRIMGDTALVATRRRTKPGDTSFAYVNGQQRIVSIMSVTKGYYLVERRNGVWTFVPYSPAAPLAAQEPARQPTPGGIAVDTAAVLEVAALTESGAVWHTDSLRIIGDTAWVDGVEQDRAHMRASSRRIRLENHRGVWRRVSPGAQRRSPLPFPVPLVATTSPTPAQVAAVIQRVLIMGVNEQIRDYRVVGDTVWVTLLSPYDKWQADTIRAREIRLQPLNGRPWVPGSSRWVVLHRLSPPSDGTTKSP